MTPPKPRSRPDRVSLWRYARLFREDILSAQPARLYRAWMAEFRTPFFRSYLLNQPDLVKTVLKDRPRDFPKSDRVGEGLRRLAACFSGVPTVQRHTARTICRLMRRY